MYPPDIISLILDYYRLAILFDSQAHGYSCMTNTDQTQLNGSSWKTGGKVGMSVDPLQSAYAENIKYVNNLRGKRRVKGYQIKMIETSENRNSYSRRSNQLNTAQIVFEFGITTLNSQQIKQFTQFQIEFSCIYFCVCVCVCVCV